MQQWVLHDPSTPSGKQFNPAERVPVQHLPHWQVQGHLDFHLRGHKNQQLSRLPAAARRENARADLLLMLPGYGLQFDHKEMLECNGKF